MARIERYIVVEILKPLAAVGGILVGLFASFSAARYLAEAVSETIGADVMVQLVLLKTVIALEVLVPLALYVAIVLGLGRLHRDQEITALLAAGVGSRRIIHAVLWLAIPVGLLVGSLSIACRPWAYHLSYVLDAEAHAEFNTDRLQAGKFYGNEESGRVMYVERKDDREGLLRHVFLYRRLERNSEVILARDAERHHSDPDRRAELHLRDGIWYRLVRVGVGDTTVRFARLVIFLKDSAESIGYKRKAASTLSLAGSVLPGEIAEFQWRLSRPVATILLALVAIPLSRSSPRQGKHERTVVAMLVFAVYYNLSGLAQTWVEQGMLGAVPGVWWLHALMLCVVGAILLPEYRQTVARRR
ncbi:MAG: LPS export ABC transporter permease LptF [Gammaproteobacteria bacterium]|nr:LPS export ABC transporter permease LptF [Gammaproteobacteria bacterium]